MRPMLNVRQDPWAIELAEPVGCSHETQVITVPAPPGTEQFLTLHDVDHPTQLAWFQRSLQDPTVGFVLLPDGLPAWGRLHLRVCPTVLSTSSVHWNPEQQVLGNGKMSLRLANDQRKQVNTDGLHQGPVGGLRLGNGPWRGSMHYDTRSPLCEWQISILEQGPLRCVWECTSRFSPGQQAPGQQAPGQQHQLRITLDAESSFAVIDEDFHAGVSDQVVWDFAGDDIAERFLLTNDAAGHQETYPNHDYDGMVTCLAPWTQCSQQPYRSDAYAVCFPGGEALGVIALDGGTWRGGRLNLLELWTRRWAPGEAVARRGLPAAVKADATRCDGVPGRGTAVCEPHTCLEGWLGYGSRRWALMLDQRHAFDPQGEGTAPMSHFDMRIDVANYQAQQGRLRRVHIQHGVLGLQRQLERILDFPSPSPLPAPPAPGVACVGDERLMDHHEVRQWAPPACSVSTLTDYLEARVIGCWHGAGLATSNYVVGRPIGPCMLAYERLVADGSISGEEAARLRSRLAWLAYLNADGNYYTGEATMRPLGDPNGTEPTMMGFANQNFYTDALVVPGMFAEVFPDHPASDQWRTWSVQQFRLQLGFHVYPESGVWEESHTYCQHVLSTVYPWMLRLRDRGGPNLFADEPLQRILNGLIRQTSPPDSTREGRRVIVPFGDHGANPAYYAWLYRHYAEAIGDSTLASRLRWMHRGSLGEQDPTIQVSEHLRGLASMFRGHAADGTEMLLALRSGGAWGHHHEDDGSLWLYAKNRCLIADVANGETPTSDGARKHAPEGHSRWAPRGMKPRGFLWRFARGYPLAHDLTAPYPYSLAWCPLTVATAPQQFHVVYNRPWHHQRLVVQLAPGLWFIHDRCRPKIPADVRFHVGGVARISAGSASIELANGESLTLQSLSGHQPVAGFHDHSAKERKAGQWADDTWEVVFPCGPEDSSVLISVGATATAKREGNQWNIQYGSHLLRISLSADHLQVAGPDHEARIPVWLDPPLRSAAPQ